MPEHELLESDNALDIAAVEVENGPGAENTGGRDLIDFLCGPLAILWKEYPRDMDATLLDDKKHQFSLGGECPHCHRQAVFMMVTNPHVTKTSATREQLAAAMQCPGCLKYILGVVEQHVGRIEYKAHYPMGAPNDAVDEAAPTEIAGDFAEALRCAWVGSYKAAIAMCRRSVEAACVNLNAKGKRLVDKIDDLANRGVITDPLKQMAHRVRLTGNTGLHGKSAKKKTAPAETEETESAADDLATFSAVDAEAMIEFVRQFFQHVYVMPALLKRYENPKAASGGTPPPSPPSGSTP